MTTSYQVETGDRVISDALLKTADEHGWKGLTNLRGQHRPWLLLNGRAGEGFYDWNWWPADTHQTVTIPEFIRLVRKGPTPTEPLIAIGNWNVRFEKDDRSGFTVAGIFVPRETVDKIHAWLHAND